MNNLSQFLSVFEGLIKTEQYSKQVILDSFKDVIGVDLDDGQLNVEEFRIYLDTHPVIKNEVLLKKEELLNVIQSKTGKSFDSVS